MITKERAAFETDTERRLAEASGTPLLLEVDWESFERAPYPITMIESRAVPQLAAALRDICAARGWRDTVRERLRRLVILPAVRGERPLALMSGGTLSVRLAPNCVPNARSLKDAFAAAG